MLLYKLGIPPSSSYQPTPKPSPFVGSAPESRECRLWSISECCRWGTKGLDRNPVTIIGKPTAHGILPSFGTRLPKVEVRISTTLDAGASSSSRQAENTSFHFIRNLYDAFLRRKATETDTSAYKKVYHNHFPQYNNIEIRCQRNWLWRSLACRLSCLIVRCKVYLSRAQNLVSIYLHNK